MCKGHRFLKSLQNFIVRYPIPKKNEKVEFHTIRPRRPLN